MGSNGLTSARHDVFHHDLAKLFPESYDASIPDEFVYSGALSLTDEVENSSLNAGQLVLSPTRTYAPIIIEMLAQFRKDIHGMVHCSGGGQTKVLHFIDNLHIVKDTLFETPTLFKLIQAQSKTPWEEMYKVFNMGHRMELYVPEKIAEELIRISKNYGVDAKIIGYVSANEGKKVTVKGAHGEFVYQ
jgi:phosphoribosylformylglycinamidine cyclo-ligase